jgi:hypothetical protein
MNIIATQCVICGHKLTDPLSIEIGIGPDCRKDGGYEDADAAADWGAALRALGNDCPAELYEVVVEAHGTRKGHGDGEVDTSLADAAKAIRGIGTGDNRRPGLCWYLATSLERPVTREGVVRILMAIHELGYTKLARALATGLVRRPLFRDKFDLKLADVTVYRPASGAVLAAGFYSSQPAMQVGYAVEMSYDFAANSRVRSLGGRFVKVKRGGARPLGRGHSFWAIPASVTPRALFDALMGGDLDVIAGEKGLNTAKPLSNPSPTIREWWTEPCEESDRVCWVDADGQLVRYTVPGEPPARPGMEKVPAAFFGHTLAAKVAS